MIDTNDFERLRRIGLTPALMPAVMTAMTTVALAGAEPTLMRVTEVQREGVTLNDGGAEHDARLLPALRAALANEGDAVAVGDWVLAGRNTYGEWWVHTRVPPLNQLARRLHDGRDKVTRVVIVSNVDTALLVMGLDHDYSPRRLERYLALVRMAGVAAVVVLTKADLCDDVAGRLQQVQALLPQGAAAVAVNALGTGDEAPGPALAPWLQAGQTLVLLGSSGAGKSTLTNALTLALPGAGQDTGPNRAGDSRGRHTTTARSLHAMPQGACIIDTPGLRTLRLDGDADQLDAVFDDIVRLAPLCRFRDCGHDNEPGCAVRAAVSPERLRNYHKLQREARRDSITALERKALVSQWKARGRAARERLNAKRG
ncbi:MAG: ribosome small subunit-dependent GTPase A [Rubrivivax sp.]|nr:ribosome small subunit-dependent GTPase A [Betaproteobacteria bacterium]MBP6319712.1 ribosome small subunit-dependent GTPase A [Rubrivivax sp.]MBK7275338.1 ribosome small subunit-dependent GTPase A [Betaproteobacteria bacterium]MBK7459084.1 ribosome small subunit-dependent GTPase A [Betaproteobacteria bacterium]MBK7514517.1 ribosome small subunit-dependent GTPase A [Betaproteobacteria bacterium]